MKKNIMFISFAAHEMEQQNFMETDHPPAKLI